MTKRHLNIDFKRLSKGQHIFHAPQSCNKSGSLKSLEGESVLLICARNSLLSQLQDRFPKTLEVLHYETDLDENKVYKQKEDIRNLHVKGFAWNYSSLKKMSDFKEHDRTFEYCIVDEPILLWAHSTGYRPDWANESEYLARIIHTPIVVYLGADFPEHILDEIDEIGALRREQTIHFEQPYKEEPEFTITKDSHFYKEEYDVYDDDEYQYIEDNDDRWGALDDSGIYL